MSVKKKVTLQDLLQLLHVDEYTDMEIQIENPNGDGWDDYETIRGCSNLLLPYYNAQAKIISIEDGTLRISIDFDSLGYWLKKQEDNTDVMDQRSEPDW